MSQFEGIEMPEIPKAPEGYRIVALRQSRYGDIYMTPDGVVDIYKTATSSFWYVFILEKTAWRADAGDYYEYITSTGERCEACDISTFVDAARHRSGNYFRPGCLTDEKVKELFTAYIAALHTAEELYRKDKPDASSSCTA